MPFAISGMKQLRVVVLVKLPPVFFSCLKTAFKETNYIYYNSDNCSG